ncbi:hypothetical protein CHY68_21750 [Salmonella enterica]|uniref:hypothetical protein n=1 Tax=Salmonella enterica TaxID=28901 RepID=UPI000FB79E4C|nr:hypothetical protein [Salmonella enterica]EBS3174628.1 hypothetical protein [Salmonella enterica subsp. enterica serovar Newport]EBV2447375.1 hypothetical protein [Salmonella enterica subsp. enterica serovar Typhimurium]EBV3792263.1 hypothetical protein [Salmonella enterica subsp. enterica serovar Stanley]ECD1935861.1 hypothetical protein [Salmonella enterica subsp. enterica serovar Muenster]ECI7591317.1 hypothetical protein [Salmonella enterica subsp. enterica]EDJ9084305.1 hypothetical pr
MKIFKIGDIHPSVPHLFADLAELAAAINYTGRFDLHKNDLITIKSQSNTSVDDIDQEDQEEENEGSDAERNDRLERQVEDVWTQLDFRQNFLKDIYPFVVNGDFISLKENLTNIQRIYLFLLACSRLRSFKKAKKGIIQFWAKNFAVVSKLCTSALLPPHATVRIFDANSDDRRTYYGTDLRKALKIMGRDLAVPYINEQECERASSSGDAGFDIIATVEFDDKLSSNYALLGQCGAQETEWPKKTLEAHSLKLRTYFQVHFDIPTLMFTPIFYRNSNGEWVDNSPCAGVLVIDRARILQLLKKTNHCPQIVAEKWFVEFEQIINDLKVD